MECSFNNIKDSNNSCQFVKDNCNFTFLNFYVFHYCLVDSNVYLTIPLLIFFSFVCFYILSDTSNQYLSTALTYISEKLNLSQNFAGVTLLALGNAAPDVIANIVASDGVEGLGFAVASTFGAGLFITCFVLSWVIYYGKEIKINKYMFTRDIVFYFIAVCLLSYMAIDEIIQLWEIIAFIAIYIIYITFAYIQDKMSKNIEKKELVNEVIDDIGFEIITQEVDDNSEKLISNSTNDIMSGKSSIIDIKNDHFESKEEIPKVDQTEKNYKKKLLFNQYSNAFYRLKINYFKQKDISWNRKNIIQKIYYLIFILPLTFARDITIPTIEDHKWNNILFNIMPFSSILFITTITNTFQYLIIYYYIGIIILVLSIISIFLLWRITYRSRVPNCKTIISIFTFIMSMFWIWYFANFLIDILNFIGEIFEIPDMFLGMTVLAIGNSLPDLSINCALAKAGYGEMGISGSIAGPLFNMLVGLGLSFLVCIVDNNWKAMDFRVYESKILIIYIASGVLIFNIFRIFVQSIFQRFKLKKSISYIGLLLYISFVLTICYFIFISDKLYLK